jgi:uncharacterized protein YndB with AHSA1/START domain
MSSLNVTAEPGQHTIVITREFNAPRALLFRAMMEPDLLAQWWGGPDDIRTIIDKFEPRPGGQWRFIQKDADGNEYAFHGVHHAIEAPERIVYTFEFEGMPGHVLLETITLEERDGKTLMTALSVFQSVEDRDGMVAAGMESGAAASWDRLEALAQSLS